MDDIYKFEDDPRFQPDAIAQEFAEEIVRYLNDAPSAEEAEQRKSLILETIQVALAAYVYEPAPRFDSMFRSYMDTGKDDDNLIPSEYKRLLDDARKQESDEQDDSDEQT